MRIIYKSQHDYAEIKNNNGVYYVGKYMGTFDPEKKALVLGRFERLEDITDEKPFKLPLLVYELIDMAYLVIATKKEALKLKYEKLFNADKSERYYIIKRKEFDYTQIKGVNCWHGKKKVLY